MNSNEITLQIPLNINVSDLVEELGKGFSEQGLKALILDLDMSQQDLNFSLSLVEDLLFSIKESVCEDEEHIIDEARELIEYIGWR